MAQPLTLLLTLTLIILGSSHVLARPAHPRPADPHTAPPASDPQASVVQQMVQTAALSFPLEPLKTLRREDLEELLSAALRQPGGDIKFYELQSPPGPAFDHDPDWIVAMARSTGDVYRLNGFLGSWEEFNRLTSRLALSISTSEEAVSLGKLFLECCVGGEGSEVVVDEGGLRHAVQDDYYNAYGDVWRMMDAYAERWRASRINVLGLAPGIGLQNGRYILTVKRVLMAAGRSPQLQECNLEISRDGNVRLVAIHPIFPKAATWLFYDMTKPTFCSKHKEIPFLGSLGCATLPGAWYGLAASAEGEPDSHLHDQRQSR
jgi:hypothetical protein